MIPLKNLKFVYSIGRCFNIDRNLQSYTTKELKFNVFRQKYANLLDSAFAQIGLSISNKKVIT